jgi:hypothetical protein
VLLKRLRTLIIGGSVAVGLVWSTHAKQGGGGTTISPTQSAIPAGGGGSTGLPTARRTVDQTNRGNPIQPPPGGGA